MAHRVRQQAGAYRFCGRRGCSVVRRFLRSCRYRFGRAGIPCRSALAREGNVSATAAVNGPPNSPASRLLQILRPARVYGRAGIRCRSALAREGIVSTTAGVNGPPRSPASRRLQVSRAGVRSCATATAFPAKNPNYCFHRLPTYVRTPFSLPSQIRMMASSISQTRICPQCPST